MSATDPRRGVSEELSRAIVLSPLSMLPPRLRDRILADALPVGLPAGSVIYRDDDDPRCGLIVRGLVRVFMSDRDGRTVTVRYARAGELLGIPVVVGGPMPVSVEMLTDAELMMFNTSEIRHLGQSEPEVGWMLAREISLRLQATLEAVAVNAFGSLRSRISRNLLDLAIRQRDGELLAPVTQQALADSVGSTRTAVARIVAELRDAGSIATRSGGIALLNPEQLHAEM
jgi:CRP/FNR family transcriptional regulator, cyclic AMP receptor protein